MPPFCLDHLSLVDLDALTLIEAAAESGFAAVSLFGTPIPIGGAENLVTDGAARARVLAALRANNLSVGIVEPFMLEPQIDWPMFERLAALAAEMGGTVNMLGMDEEPARLEDSLARLVDIARAAGAPVIMEAFPLSAIRTPAIALRLAEALGEDVGLCIDSLHIIRSGGSWADVAALPSDRIRHVQLNDGPLDPPADRRREAALERLLPGEGAFDLSALLPLLPDHATIAVEAPRPAVPGKTPAARASELMRSMRSLYA